MSFRSDGGESRRAFPRVFLQPGGQPLSKLLGSKVIWQNGDEGEINDLSYSGLAVLREAGANFQPGQHLTFQLAFPGQSNVDVEGEVIRQTEKVVAIKLNALSTEARLAIDKYLHEKLVGIHVRRIDPKFFARPGSHTHWFHGPNNTNIFLWYDQMNLKKAVVESGNRFLEWEDGKFREGNSKELLDGERDQYTPAYLENQPLADAMGFTPFMNRVLDLMV